MTTHKDKIKDYCERIREARQKATPGEWTDGEYFIDYADKYLRHKDSKQGPFYKLKGPNLDDSEDIQFIALSANEILKLCDAIDKMTEALEFYNQIKITLILENGQQDMTNAFTHKAQSALEEVERILE